MALENNDFIKATVNGKKAGLVVYGDYVWLLSYVSAWDTPALREYRHVPAHSFHRKRKLCHCAGFCSFVEFRRHITRADNDIFSMYFPGEQGFEREIRRRNRVRSMPETVETPQENAPAQEAPVSPDIDFYLPNYSTDNIYQGQHSYHSSHAAGFLNRPTVPFSGHRIGVELEIEANTTELRAEIVAKKSNWFTRERDGSLNGYGIEFITIPLLPDDAKSYATWQPLCDYLKTRAKSWNSGRCGLHVHIGREILGVTEEERHINLGKLLIFYQGDIETWSNATAVFGRERCFRQRDGDTDEIKAVRCLGKNALKDPAVLSKVDAAMKTKFNGDRYYAVNLQNSATIEFRKGRGSINSDRIIAIITFTEALCLFVKATQPCELTLENFQRWLFNHVPCGNPVYRYLNITQTDA